MQLGTIEAGLQERKFYDMHKNPHSSGFATATPIIQSSGHSTGSPGHSSGDAGTRGPEVFLVEQSPNSVACAHFHPVDQFQVVVAGSGQLGRHDIAACTVHYSNPYTGYGPIIGGSEGISYITLRRVADVKAPFFLPEAKVHLKAGPRLNLTSERVISGDPKRVAEVACEAVIAVRPDGVGAWLLRMPPGAVALVPDANDGGGQFRLVIAGGMNVDETILPRFGCCFVSPEESKLAIVAGPEGLEVLVMQFSHLIKLQ